jgi:hypothetical protein
VTDTDRAAQLDAKARKMTAARTTAQLCNDFALTEELPANDLATPKVRGWIMDELEKRDPEAFETWIWADELPHRFFGVTPQQA